MPSQRRTPSPEASLLDRIRETGEAAAGRDEIARNLLHAYTACLSFADLVDAAINQLAGPGEVRRALRNRLVRLAGSSATPAELEAVASRLIEFQPADRLSKTTIDTLLSHLYEHLPVHSRQAVLERWMDMGTRDAAGRWLKALRDDEALFDGATVLAYWRKSGDDHAAKLLAYYADVDLLQTVVAELIEGTSEGWIVSRAVVRLGRICEENWERVRQRFPATYAYLCAKLGRAIPTDEAVLLVQEVEGGILGQRGLAIWALGEMKMRVALDAVWAMADQLERADLAAMGIVILETDR